MAGSEFVLSDLLCFLNSKFGNVAVKPLKSWILDFFQVEDLCEAKAQLLRDIQQLNCADVPHIPDRRAGNDQAVKVVDDIFTALTYIDEQLKMNELPVYVSKSPDCMPCTRLYEGDLAVLMNLLMKMDAHIIDNKAVVSAIANDLSTLHTALKSVTDYSQVRRPAINNACGRYSESMHSTTETIGMSVPLSDQVFNQSADGQVASPSLDIAAQLDWATMASKTSVPVEQSNRYAALRDDHGDDSDDRPFTEVRSRRATKRRRQLSRQSLQQRPAAHQSTSVDVTAGQPQVQHQQQQPTPRQRSARLLTGKASAGVRGLGAARKLIKKAVFCVDNVDPSYDVDDVRTFVTGLSVTVFSCFRVEPRRRRSDRPGYITDRRAFRLCIDDADRDTLLDANVWPDSVTVSDWYFKPPAADQHQQSQQPQQQPQPQRPCSAGCSSDTTRDAGSSAQSTMAAEAATVAMVVGSVQQQQVSNDVQGDVNETTVIYYDDGSA